MEDQKVLKPVVIISNITLNPFFTQCIYDMYGKTQVEYIGLAEYWKERDEILYNNPIIIIWFELFELLSLDLKNSLYVTKQGNSVVDFIYNDIKALHDSLTEANDLMIYFVSFYDGCDRLNNVWGNIISPCSIANNLNEKLYCSLGKKWKFINFANLIVRIGWGEAYNENNYYRWNAPYSKKLVCAVAQEIIKQNLISHEETPKCIVLDCDGVLWGGTVVEDGIENIELSNSGKGKRYKDFQEFVYWLYKAGVIIALCSKNDADAVSDIFEHHSDMILKKKHIAMHCVNWEDKPKNIMRISQELNIGLESMVFIDDSEYEVQAVRQSLSEVRCIRFDYKSIYLQLACFNLNIETDNESIKKRQNTYKTNIQRKNMMQNSNTYKEYIRALEMNVDIHTALIEELRRLSELSMRTNKCTNGVRYDITELKKRWEDPEYDMYSVKLSDKFGDLGIIGAIGIFAGRVDWLCMSCRAMGREIEDNMIEFVKKKHIICGIKSNDTGKNKKFIRLLEENLCSSYIELKVEQSKELC